MLTQIAELRDLERRTALASFTKTNSIYSLGAHLTSLWRVAAGNPAQPAIPGAAAVVDSATAGSFVPFTNPGAGIGTYVVGAAMSWATTGSNSFQVLLDRLAHMGGLSGTVTTAQTVGVDVSGSSSNLAERRGASDYSDVLWFVEIYTDVGTTGTTLSVTYTNAAGTPGQVASGIAFSGASPLNRAARMIPLILPGNCRSIQDLTLAATTATAGSFGVTACRALGPLPGVVMGQRVYGGDWARVLARLPDSCHPFVGQFQNQGAGVSLTGVLRLLQV
jgi:hypothetical protein